MRLYYGRIKTVETEVAGSENATNNIDLANNDDTEVESAAAIVNTTDKDDDSDAIIISGIR